MKGIYVPVICIYYTHRVMQLCTVLMELVDIVELGFKVIPLRYMTLIPNNGSHEFFNQEPSHKC